MRACASLTRARTVSDSRIVSPLRFAALLGFGTLYASALHQTRCASTPTPEQQYAVGSETLNALQDEFQAWYKARSLAVMQPADLVALEDIEATWVGLEAAALAALADLRAGSPGASERWNDARLRVVEWLVKMGAKR